MKHIIRCYGCGRIIWPWSDIVKTKRVGSIHKDCLIAACMEDLGVDEIRGSTK